ncbi:anucleate primary sterigmata protein A [Ophiocordyceps sinensis CO18]|uniref:Anucleate primary sterigmata protein A n=1 Tax=Ophiocordyceps sinensis (strain Co18 / CGMCC 3.14243) TaxID=911162 RepID=T5AQQ4_OPHSC|nr:anucleate primary sterigmata protein A [Ophiocordyceps sinensis CO18]
MASSLASDGRPSLPAPEDAANDPFVAVAASKTHHRFSDFDQDLFAAGPGSSPTQAKLALEAHLAETDRRLEEAGKLGTALVSQRKALTEQLQEVEQLQAEGQIGPDLRKKLAEVEREYNDVARESARVFLPKQRMPSNEANPGSPYVPEARGGRRSVSPSKFESQATGSPTKLNVPNRRSRNQPTNRVHDIEFAAEISTSLIAQVRNLQSLLSERDEENKTLHSERSNLEIEAENLQQRLRTLDESEHRYKEENWNLETRLQELASQQREAADREKRLTQALGISNADKSAARKELDEVKLSHSKLAEEHAAVTKHHDIEWGTAKRTMVMAEGERAALQRKIDDLTSQNQELAKAYSMQRGRAADREPGLGASDDDFETATDNMTPEHSPPPSPIKNTPRHSMLETETVKTSLQHAQRTIQSQRNQLHREKTEKLELRRIIQDLRDDLEKVRTDAAGAASSRRSRKVESKDLKKSQRLLGSFRSSRHEILVDDPEWEDNPDAAPGAASPSTGFAQGAGTTSRGDASDEFDTANEASESAFETANERATETEDFQTGNEKLSGSDDTETETETPSRGFGRMRHPPKPVTEPEVPRPALTMAPVLAQVVDPVATPPPSLTLSSISTETVEPVAEPDVPKQVPAFITPALPELIMSIIRSEHVEPVSEPNILVTSPSLTLSTIRAEQLEPREEVESVWPQPPLAFSGILAEHIQSLSEPPPIVPTLALSSIVAEHTHPITEAPPSPPALAMSSISSEQVEPVVSSLLETPTLPSFGFTNIESIETRPLSPRSLRRDGFILPRDDDFYNREHGQPQMAFNNKALGLALGRGRKGDFFPIIAEDETSQPHRDAPEVETPESQRPFKEISSNSNGRLPRKQREPTSDQGAQTSLTSSAIDKLLNSEPQPGLGHHHASMSSMGSPDTTGTVKVHRWQETLDSPVHGKGSDEPASEKAAPPFRPGSATSGSIHDVPPLPSNHRQLIDAARTGSARGHPSGHLGSMGPPLWPASAMKHQRPRTPIEQRPTSAASVRANATPRFNRGGSAHGTAEIYSPSKLTTRSRKSSVSSFASELDTRFNIRPGEMGMGPAGFSPDTDPRMIQAITQTMIGEFLWKYTRKPGRGEMSDNRHKRYFWVHPYTRTLYWSDRDPSNAGRTELKAKSVPIEAVRVVSDDNPMPPGLHRKSLIIISPGRTIKFTCTTGQRHETWFNALSYLLLRTERNGQSDAQEMAENMTREDVEEFNPQFGGRAANGSQPEAAPPSLSSYHSRTTRNETVVDGASMEIPTLTPANCAKPPGGIRTSAGTLSKLSGYWKSGAPKLSGTFSSLRGRGSGSQPVQVYEASEVHDSAEDLREMIERQDRDSDRLENVRACCDGKHDKRPRPARALAYRTVFVERAPGVDAFPRLRSRAPRRNSQAAAAMIMGVG